MSKSIIALIIGAGIFGIIIIVAFIIFGMGVSFSNKEVMLKNTIVAKQTDNKNQMDAMWKTISQVAQVTEAQKNALLEIFTGYATARTGENKGGSLANWIHESVPNVDTSTFNNLQNIILSQRDGFKTRQTELLDLNREHDNLIGTFPNSMFASILGRVHIDVTIVTSTRTENAFKNGEDDDVQLFNNKK